MTAARLSPNANWAAAGICAVAIDPMHPRINVSGMKDIVINIYKERKAIEVISNHGVLLQITGIEGMIGLTFIDNLNKALNSALKPSEKSP